MTKFQIVVIASSIVWLAILGVSILGASGLALNFIKNESSSYLFWGGLLGLSSVIFVFLLNIPFDEEAQAIQKNANQKEKLSQLKEFIGLLVSVFGGGISGNLIVSAIIEHRKTHANAPIA